MTIHEKIRANVIRKAWSGAKNGRAKSAMLYYADKISGILADKAH